MGQAKNRGTREDRVQQAKVTNQAARPEHLVCNECHAKITDIHQLDTKGMRGIRVAYAGVCTCGSTTYGIQGDQDAVEKAAMALQEQFDFQLKVGLQTTTHQLTDNVNGEQG
ncbi:MAG: hypothetical protein CTY35_01905 [Methylotenera sp.]|uniref:hypothetical protein n=1 Tax=Methylotenera sp. TaxID=2051956 RepID=UPI000D4730DF|nr:hypothetical protein [Methylotenera sp.]PPC84385.1 MAG: hypothetical protein CTY38_02125 [Methylotenera sp.]PPD01027.1 MAG: hypothetical protein CTY35_01905 [Methylotenera sp.]